MEKIHPHKFHRTMATRAIDKGMPIEQVQKILGHSQIDTTMQYAIVNQTNVKTSHQKFPPFAGRGPLPGLPLPFRWPAPAAPLPLLE